VTRLAAVRAPQPELDLTTDADRARAAEDEQRERTRQARLHVELLGAMRAATIAMGGTKVVAGRLDELWGDVGESKYRAAIRDVDAPAERNYNHPRIEWLIELALDPRVADVLRAIADGKADIEADEELENLYDILAEELPKQAASLRRRARSMRKRKDGTRR
jgi:hypothetical protein